MRSILFHCKYFESTITGLSTRPDNIVHENILDEKQSSNNCILVFVTIEKNDSLDKSLKLVDEVASFSKDTKHRNVFLCPFAHLSNNLASAKEAMPILERIAHDLKSLDINLIQGHFGSDKELLIHLYGHPGNARYREF
jgi:threonyl-tRNA synthetase